jgi:acetyl esterase/lipase
MSSFQRYATSEIPEYLPKRNVSAFPGFRLNGRLRFKAHALWNLYTASLEVTFRHIFQKKLVNSWSWGFACTNLFMQKQMKFAFSQRTIGESRKALDALVFNPAEKPAVFAYTSKGYDSPLGTWYMPENAKSGRVMLYFHGGGYAFNSSSHGQMLSLIAEASATKTFALDYRLTPEHPHPAQIEDALAAYTWLLHSGYDASSIIIAGDSAGGHLALMALIAFREAGLPQPALAIGLCPWTYTGNRGSSLFDNNRYDWVQGEQTVLFSQWYRNSEAQTDDEVSPLFKDLRGLAPIYLQAGGKEILYDMICDFSKTALCHGAILTLDIWKDMTHDFQAYGNMLPESREALNKIGAKVYRYLERKDIDLFPHSPSEDSAS